MLSLPARATIRPSIAATAPTGTSPRAPARRATASATRMSSTSSRRRPWADRPRGSRSAPRSTDLTLLSLAGGLRLAAALLVAAAFLGLLLALLHLVFTDRHGFRDALHRAARQGEV